jgi:hypothetical protein
MTVAECKYDRDGDGFGGRYFYCGACPAGQSATATDCHDGNPSANPNQTAFFDYPMTFSDGTPPSFDWNCNQKLEPTTVGAYYVCTDSTGKKTDDCSKCTYNFVLTDGGDCGQTRCSPGGGPAKVACH